MEARGVICTPPLTFRSRSRGRRYPRRTPRAAIVEVPRPPPERAATPLPRELGGASSSGHVHVAAGTLGEHLGRPSSRFLVRLRCALRHPSRARRRREHLAPARSPAGRSSTPPLAPTRGPGPADAEPARWRVRRRPRGLRLALIAVALGTLSVVLALAAALLATPGTRRSLTAGAPPRHRASRRAVVGDAADDRGARRDRGRALLAQLGHRRARPDARGPVRRGASLARAGRQHAHGAAREEPLARRQRSGPSGRSCRTWRSRSSSTSATPSARSSAPTSTPPTSGTARTASRNASTTYFGVAPARLTAVQATACSSASCRRRRRYDPYLHPLARAAAAGRCAALARTRRGDARARGVVAARRAAAPTGRHRRRRGCAASACRPVRRSPGGRRRWRSSPGWWGSRRSSRRACRDRAALGSPRRRDSSASRSSSARAPCASSDRATCPCPS